MQAIPGLTPMPSAANFLLLRGERSQFLDRLRGRVNQDYKRLPYPITNDLFYVTRDGVAGTLPEAA